MDLVGTTVGRIRIVESLGKGGMGAVYAGWDEKLKRKVALKVIRDDRRLDAEAKARFLREARILSQLDHPGICRLYELLEEADTDFLVLELIEGKSLKQALADGLGDGAKLFVAERVAEALAAAHAKGVVHRDLKPENVMLTNDGKVKVLDFGLAHTVDSQLAAAIHQETQGATETTHGNVAPSALLVSGSDSDTRVPTPIQQPDTTTVLRRHGPQTTVEPTVLFETQQGTVMGTVAYMSPEQARGERGTAAGDIYSFGLLLQELFTGESPYGKGLTVLEMLYKAARAETSQATGVDSDLAAWIQRMKSVAPEARPSARETLERLWWIGGKSRRRWRQVAAAALVTAALMAGLLYVSNLRQERQRAVEAQAEAEAVSEFLLGVFAAASPHAARGQVVTARDLLDAGSVRIDAELQDRPERQARLMHTMGQAYRHLGFLDRAESLLRRALELHQQSTRRDGESGRLDTAGYLDQLGSLYHDQGRFAEAVPLFLEALDLRKAMLGPDHLFVAESANNLAFLYRAQGDLVRAEPLFLQALAIQEARMSTDGPGSGQTHLVRSLNNLGELYRRLGNPQRAEAYLQRAISMQEDDAALDPTDLSTSLNNLASVYHDQGDVARAEPLYLRALQLAEGVLGSEHPHVAASLNNMAELYRLVGRFADAEPLYLSALAIQEAALGMNHPTVATTLSNLADLCLVRGEVVRAESLYSRALAAQQATLGAEHPEVATTLNHQADLRLAVNDLDAAEGLYRRALAIQEATLGVGHDAVALTLTDLAALATRQGQFEQAEALYGRALASLSARAAEAFDGRREIARLAAARLGLGRLYKATGRDAKAAEAWTRVVEEMTPLTSNSRVMTEVHTHVMALHYLGRDLAAAPLAEVLQVAGWKHPEFLGSQLPGPPLSGR